jgi:hypothetical protein
MSISELAPAGATRQELWLNLVDAHTSGQITVSHWLAAQDGYAEVDRLAIAHLWGGDQLYAELATILAG